MVYHLLAITMAIVIDLIIGDPPTWPHPVKWIGSGIAKLDRKLNEGERRRWKGSLMLLLIISITFLLSLSLVWFMYQLHFLVGIIVEAILIATTISQKGLRTAALDVYIPLKEGNLVEARAMLSRIVGRDTVQLSEDEVIRGTVETVAENISDGVTAPLFWAFIGGAPFALVYRAINTCDSMVGYQNERYEDFGWASAKMDDIVNWLPSRITGLLILIGNKPTFMTRKQARHVLFRDAKKHKSPNSGWLEASVATLLGIQLGGDNYYNGSISKRAKMGEQIVNLKTIHIQDTNRILHRASFLFLLLLWTGGVVIELAKTWL